MAALISLRPDDLRDAPAGPEIVGAPHTPLYATDNEWAAEIVNRTVHALAGAPPPRTSHHRARVPPPCAAAPSCSGATTSPSPRSTTTRCR